MNNLFDRFTESFSLISVKIFQWVDKMVLSLPNLILVLVALLVGLKLIKLANKLIARLVIKSVPKSKGVQNLVKNVGSFFFYIALGILLLSILGLKGTVTTVLASAGVAGLALGLALQDPLMNLFSGIIMSVKHVFDVGDLIESNGFMGEVIGISLKNTEIRMMSGEEVHIPNKLVLQNPVKNFSTTDLRRVDFTCGISYAEDLEFVKRVTMEAVGPLALNNIERPLEFIYTNFGDSSIDFQVRFWTNAQDVWQYLDAKSNAIMKVRSAFNEHNITIPFPIRTLDFGIKGGVSLEENISPNSRNSKASSLKP